jgi:hypothetical protein
LSLGINPLRAKQVENLSLGILNSLVAPILQIESLLDYFKPVSVATLGHGNRGDRPIGRVHQVINVIGIVAWLAYYAGIRRAHGGTPHGTPPRSTARTQLGATRANGLGGTWQPRHPVLTTTITL